MFTYSYPSNELLQSHLDELKMNETQSSMLPIKKEGMESQKEMPFGLKAIKVASLCRLP